ncbi:carbohydrate ABC transporter permease [Aggregatilinea lenta]|uniref:carbohydrate ABC transporter permease n=1 Tax=Aggregatilinea lenta TaxID=913108 RepID=UPI000E5B9EAC|nr:sugar ABC transporter permease [Aggregatilinea lenta]
MLEWLDSSVLTLFGAAITRFWVAAALLALVPAWWARRKNFSAGMGYLVAVALPIAASEIVRTLIPDANQTFERGQTPSASYTVWSDAAFRADLGLVLLSIVLILVAARLIDWLRQDERAESPRRWRLSATGSAVVLAIPLVAWIWAAGKLLFQASYGAIALPLVGFVALVVIAGLLAVRLDGWRRSAGLLALSLIVVLAQVWFNSTRGPASMFESNGSVPFFLPLIPVGLGMFAAPGLASTWRKGDVLALGWQLGALAWMVAAVGWLVRFLGFYDFQNSFAFGLGTVLNAPVRVLSGLSAIYYDRVPREIAGDANAANMATWESSLVVLVGVLALVWIMWRTASLPARTQPRTLSATVERARHPQFTLSQRRYILAFALILPALALRTFTTFYPFLQTVALSVQKYNPAFPPREYVALRNFERLSTDLVVRESLEFTILFVFVSTFFQVVLGLAIAHLLNANFNLRGFARTVSLIPWAVPMVVAAIGFRWMFDDQFGMIPDLLRRLFSYQGTWLVDPEHARMAVTFVNVWKSTPFAALLLLAGLQGVSEDLYEAAKVDGANWIDALRFITVPMLMPIIVTISMFLLVWQLAAFDLPFAMTGGGPGFSTTVLAQKIYLEINSLNYSYAAAVSIALVVVVTVIGGLGLVALRRSEVSA